MTATIYQLPTRMQQASSHLQRPARLGQSPPVLARQTMEFLLSFSQAHSNASPSDHSLAMELLALSSGEGTPAEHAALQRLNLVDHLFGQMLVEPHLPTSCRSYLEALRLPIIKNALVDAAFFLQPQHPLRQIMHNTQLSAMTACAKGAGALRQAEVRLQDLPVQVDLSANFVLPALGALEGLTDSQVNGFFEQLRHQATERAQTLANLASRAVAHELEELTLGLKLPEGVATFVQFGLNPLLTAIMLKHGVDSVRWTAQMSRVHNLLTSYEPANAARTTADRSGLISSLTLDLVAIGMPHDCIQKLISLLNKP